MMTEMLLAIKKRRAFDGVQIAGVRAFASIVKKDLSRGMVIRGDECDLDVPLLWNRSLEELLGSPGFVYSVDTVAARRTPSSV